MLQLHTGGKHPKKLIGAKNQYDFCLNVIVKNIEKNLLGKSMSINWQYPAPEHISSILEYLVCRQSLTQANISCLDKLSVVTLVLYTLTAIIPSVTVGKTQLFHLDFFLQQ